MSVIWERGSSTSTGEAYIGGVATGGYGGAYATTTTQTRTRAAVNAAPPNEPDMRVSFTVLMWSAIIFLGLPKLVFHQIPSQAWIVFLVVGAIPIWYIASSFYYIWNVYPGQMRRWRSLYQCGRCGNVGVPLN